MMKTIKKNNVAVLDYRLQTLDGDIIDEGNNMAYLHGHRNLLPGMEDILEGKKVGDEIQELMPPEQAFGVKQEESIVSLHRTQFGDRFDDVYPGLALPLTDPDGNEVLLFVKEKKGDFVLLQRNHPLAGVSLVLNAKILKIRKAQPEELNDKMAYGIDGRKEPPSCGCC